MPCRATRMCAATSFIVTSPTGHKPKWTWLCDCIEQHDLPDIVRNVAPWHSTVNESELAFCLQKEWNLSRTRLSAVLQKRIEKSMHIPVNDYLVAKERMFHVMSAFDEYFASYDAILCPSALGTAPMGLESTGNPIMQTTWSFAGLPCLNLPLMNLSNGLPLGVQAVGAFQNDARLMRSAQWLVTEFIQRKMQ